MSAIVPRISRRRDRLATRFYAIGAALAVLLALVSLALLLAIADLRGASRALSLSKETVVAAGSAERETLELSTGLRGFLLTGQDRFLEPARRAADELPGHLRAMRELTRDNAEQAARAAGIEDAVGTYGSFVRREVARGPDRPRAARVTVALEAKRQLDAIRSRFDAFLRAEQRRTERRDEDARATARRAEAFGVAGLLVLLAAVPLSLAYLARAVVAPVRSVSAAAGRLEQGERDARAPELGSGEVAVLARSFNAMATALELNRKELESRGVSLAQANEQLRVAFAELERSKQQAILDLSTPVLQLSSQILVLPVIGALDRERARQIGDRLLADVRGRRARIIVIDLTGVPGIATGVAQQLLRTIAGLRLLGVRVILSGVSGELAAALVGLDVELGGIESHADLQGGIESAGRR